MKVLYSIYNADCRIFQKVNQHYDIKWLHFFFSRITFLGGATFTIITCLALALLTTNQLRITAIASALSLAISHLPVHVIKKLYPRKRPYLIVEESKFPLKALTDHSFPSGHTTAIFSVIIPFILYMPYLSILLLPIGICVGLSRIFLGLHYPSDVMAGVILGTTSGVLSLSLAIQLSESTLRGIL
ncbi:phosphatase PAP2 family protein [Fredinandcohnia sp. QZ13]|uniref:phosphatase PAP2 family protein n=1 Tax=Fredinandcohnia sp. QZ13 TaxID=3073144 RepID=UPI002852FC1F|nr:phosphatase PAP2 family protein [Fredinandcohnia sp. QZ13]MDR4887626.1 phosphatase PAP2 family protein [Fredinandcohnia sp. QZ13]